MKTRLSLILILSLLTLPALAQDAPTTTSEAATASTTSPAQAKTQLKSRTKASPAGSATPQRKQLRNQLHDGSSANCPRLNKTPGNGKVSTQHRKQQKTGRGTGICDGSGRQGNTASKRQGRHKGRNR